MSLTYYNGYLPQSCYALANNFYRGYLPQEFRDLTWIEERVCAKYSNIAVATQLYQSSDPSQPAVYAESTATVLLRAPWREWPVERRVYRTVEVQAGVSWQHVQNSQIEGLELLAVTETA